MSIFDIEERPITEKNLLGLGFSRNRLFPTRYINSYSANEENIQIIYLMTIKPQGDSWTVYIKITYFGFRTQRTSIKHAGGIFVSHKSDIWGSLDTSDVIPPLMMEVNTMNELIMLKSGEHIKQYCKEFITNDKIIW